MKMRQIFLFIILASSSCLVAQELPNPIQDKLAFCDSPLTDEEVTQLRLEFIDLETIFLQRDFWRIDLEPAT